MFSTGIWGSGGAVGSPARDEARNYLSPNEEEVGEPSQSLNFLLRTL